MTSTDLFGKPLGRQPEFHLSKWQKRQATLLYHFASLDYLKELKSLVDDFIDGVDITLGLAMKQGRDELIANPRWGMRDTATNFGTFGFPALRDFQKSINKDIARRVSEYYEFTGYNQCSRLLSELSMIWSTPDEQEYFKRGMSTIGRHASRIDSTMNRLRNDSGMAVVWQELAPKYLQLPKYRVRTDIVAESGKLPIRTGVYVPQDDPFGTLQFAWTGNSDGRLGECSTFNDLGLQALRAVGRDAMHTDHAGLVPVVNQRQFLDEFKKMDWGKDVDFLTNPINAKNFIGLEGYENRPCNWYFVEKVEGEFDDETDLIQDVPPQAVRLRAMAGEACLREGWWFTPARLNSRRHFKLGELMPDVGGDYGTTIWQWDEQQ